MRTTNSAYLPDESMFPFQGVDYYNPSTQADPHFAAEIKNVDVNLGNLVKRKGYAAVGAAVSGKILALFEWQTLAGDTKLMCITTSDEYVWSGAAWTKITFKDAAAVEHQRVGSEDDGIDYLVATGTDSTGAIKKWVIITNGVDKPRYWDGVLATFYEFSTATVANHGAALVYPSFVTCKTLSALNGYVVLGNTTTTGSEPNVVVWSDTGSLIDFINNNAGANQLTDCVGPILKIMPLGDRLMVYAQDTIHSMLHTGGVEIFSTEKIIQNTRLLSGRGIVDVGPFHYLMCQENIYIFDGTRGIRRVGDRVTNKYRETFDTSFRTRAFAILDAARNNIYFVLPSSSTTSLVFKLEFSIYDVLDSKWTIYDYASRPTTVGQFSATATIAWNTESPTLQWNQSAKNWNQGSASSGFPRLVLGGADSQVYLADDTLYDDGSMAVDASWESIDFTIPRDFLSEFGRWTEIEFEGRGDSLDISISVDKGYSYSSPQTIALDGSWKRKRVYIDSVSQTLRVKVGNKTTGQSFEIRWLRVWYTHSGADDGNN